MVGTLHFEMCRNVPKRCVVSGVLVSSVLFSYKVLDTEAPMLALPLRLPTASCGGLRLCLMRFERCLERANLGVLGR